MTRSPAPAWIFGPSAPRASPSPERPPNAVATPLLAPDAPRGPRTERLPLSARRALGGLLPLLDRPALRDLLVQVAGGVARLWLDEGSGPRAVPGWQARPAAVHQLATALIAAGGRHLDELRPSADVRMGDGIRVHAVIPPVAVAGAAVSIRVPTIGPLSYPELVGAGLCGVATDAVLRRAVCERQNILLTGATGSGKTTVLAALLDLAHPRERIITIEDLAELRLRHPHVVALESRPDSAEGVGRISLDELLREALRMRPDRIVLGECRGAELATLLAALNTGHDGGAGTLHASKIHEVPARLEALGALAGLSADALARQAVAAIDLVVHLVRDRGVPRVAALAGLSLGRGGTLEIVELEGRRERGRRAA
ncbi:CpaF family protein [Leucobacter chromiireducens]|uniref:CpaF family protein n=1 Tax=Leucobacter chromiireducens TaxID=283877 RepID=UPI003F7CF4D7